MVRTRKGGVSYLICAILQRYPTRCKGIAADSALIRRVTVSAGVDEAGRDIITQVGFDNNFKHMKIVKPKI